MSHLPEEVLARGVICASAGNHAQGVSYSARHLGIPATVVMPTTTPSLKIDAVRALGGAVILHGESYTEAYQHSLVLASSQGLTFVHPFDDPLVIAGQGTIAPEILKQAQLLGHRSVDAIFVAVGGGGLAAGVASYIKAVQPQVKVVGVQSSDSTAMLQSVQAGHLVQLETVGLFCDATAVKIPGRETFELCRTLVDEFITIDSDSISAAIKDVFTDTRVLVEPAGALALAAVKKYTAIHGSTGETFVAVVCGSNINFDRLRYIAARSSVGEEAEALFAVSIPEHPGSLRKFLEDIVPSSSPPRQVTELGYRTNPSAPARVFLGLSSNFSGESSILAKTMADCGYPALDLTHDEVAQEHVRHLLGGNSPPPAGERVFRFVFPERPGAFLEFLATLPSSVTITLLHYRSQGADYGSVLAGLRISPPTESAWSEFLQSVKLAWSEETHHPACRFFLGDL